MKIQLQSLINFQIIVCKLKKVPGGLVQVSILWLRWDRVSWPLQLTPSHVQSGQTASWGCRSSRPAAARCSPLRWHCRQERLQYAAAATWSRCCCHSCPACWHSRQLRRWNIRSATSSAAEAAFSSRCQAPPKNSRQLWAIVIISLWWKCWFSCDFYLDGNITVLGQSPFFQTDCHFS